MDEEIDDEEDIDEDDHLEYDAEERQPEKSRTAVKKATGTKSVKAKPGRKSIKRKVRKRTLYRMRNFKSYRMAEQTWGSIGGTCTGIATTGDFETTTSGTGCTDGSTNLHITGNDL
jgi:hypothetical protein